MIVRERRARFGMIIWQVAVLHIVDSKIPVIISDRLQYHRLAFPMAIQVQVGKDLMLAQRRSEYMFNDFVLACD